MDWTPTPAATKPRKRKRAPREPTRDSSLTLPPPVVERWDWQLVAACRGMDSSLFFPPDGERARARSRRVASAKSICAACPALTECRNYAVAAGESCGIWGGLTEDERAPARRLTSTG